MIDVAKLPRCENTALVIVRIQEISCINAFNYCNYWRMTMSIRSMFLMCAVAFAGCVASGDATDDQASVAQNNGGGFTCINKFDIQVVSCIGSISVLPINVNVKDVRVLNDNELTVLSNDLNDLSVLDGGILNNNKILNDVEVSVLEDFLNKFLINVSHNDIDVCTLVLGIQLCK
jgi:hypothetical protein